ncbi:MAG: HEAT repeat domain-containing protein [Planctomycetota bacterium]
MGTITAAARRYGLGTAWAIGLALLVSNSANAQAADEARFIFLQAKPSAYAIVEAAGTSENSRARLAALEAAEYAPDAAFDLARNGMSDENPAVRFGALVTVGKLKLQSLSDAAMDLTRDKNESVRAAALFAAVQCGRDVNLSPLAGMLADGSSGARANAAMLIGHLGDPQAIDMLRDMAAKPMTRVSPARRTWVRLQFAEAMIRLDPDDDKVLGTIRASVYSNLDDARVLAIQILGEVGDRSVMGGLAHIIKRDNPIQVKIAAAQSLVQMGDDQAATLLFNATRYDDARLRKDLNDYLRNTEISGPEADEIRGLLANESERVRAAADVRAQATVGLGDLRTKAAAERLKALLEDPDEIVRVAAAASILRATR